MNDHSHPHRQSANHDHDYPLDRVHPHDHVHPHEQSADHDHIHPHESRGSGIYRRNILSAGGLGIGALLLAACTSTVDSRSAVSAATTTSSSTATPGAATPGAATSSGGLSGFDEFASTVRTFISGDYWMVESTGLPAHNMMVGITSWQQQFPLPQRFSGTNAFQLPVNPVLADTPVSARTGLFRGAIALAVNGVPIFNALNNRGDDAFKAGELDEWGGHCGKADDYHYHVAPLHLQTTVGHAKPIAYALDGYALYGSLEPDGSALLPLDDFNGHTDSTGKYHYHGTTTYPYINGGLKGKVTVSQGGIEPQPVTKPMRAPGDPLRGAVITMFETIAAGSYRLTYTLNGQSYRVAYQVTEKSVNFTFTDAVGNSRTETYKR